MGQLSSVLRSTEGGGHAHWCPGCDKMHVIPKAWMFNGDVEKPTFSPSALHQWTWGPEMTEHRCHYFVTEGRIEFCGDSLHALAGKTVPLPKLADVGMADSFDGAAHT